MQREDTFFGVSGSMVIKGEIFSPEWPVIMGIVNLTPDSFHAASRQQGIDACLKAVEQQAEQGAHWIDLGAVSSRPGAEMPEAGEEKKRLLPCVEAIVQRFPKIVLSVDTFRADVAREAVEAGAAIVNDITAGEGDKTMFETIARLNVPYIMMHMRGNPQTMQALTQYTHFPEDVIAYFLNRIQRAHLTGIKDIIADPGIGFAKTTEHNFKLVAELVKFKVLGKPLLMGISRKGFIYKTLGTDAAGALNGTTALHMACLMNGASILRVHDVAAAVEVRKLFLSMHQQ